MAKVFFDYSATFFNKKKGAKPFPRSDDDYSEIFRCACASLPTGKDR